MNNQKEDLYYDLVSFGWKNDYTYEFEVLLAYGKEYKVTINYKGTDVEGYDSNVFFRDQNGNFAEEFVINFNTMDRPKRSPIEKSFNFEIPKWKSGFCAKFEENSAAPNTQSNILDLRNIGIYELQKGDKITINYNISSVYELKNIKAQLADISKEANYWLKLDKNKDEIRGFLENKFHYNLSKSLDEIRKNYVFDSRASHSVPPAIIAFLESNDYESAIRNAISLGGDADTEACIAGGIAEAYYKVIPKHIVDFCDRKIDYTLKKVVFDFKNKFCETL
jgi:hypothetical protein